MYACVFVMCTWQDLGDIDPVLLQGLEKMRDYEGGDDEDVFCRDFRVREELNNGDYFCSFLCWLSD